MPPQAELQGPGILGSDAHRVLHGELHSIRVERSAKSQEQRSGLQIANFQYSQCGVRLEKLLQAAVAEFCSEAEYRKYFELFNQLSQLTASSPDDRPIRVITYDVFQTWATKFNITGVNSILCLFRRLNDSCVHGISETHFLSVLLALTHPTIPQGMFCDPRNSALLSDVDSLPAVTTLRIYMLFVRYHNDDGNDVDLSNLVHDVLTTIFSNRTVIDKLQPEELAVGRVFMKVVKSFLGPYHTDKAIMKEQVVPKPKPSDASRGTAVQLMNFVSTFVPKAITTVQNQLGYSTSKDSEDFSVPIESPEHNESVRISQQHNHRSLARSTSKQTPSNGVPIPSCGEGTMSIFDASCMRSTSAGAFDDEESELRIDEPEHQEQLHGQLPAAINGTRDRTIQRADPQGPANLECGDNYGSVTEHYYSARKEFHSSTTPRRNHCGPAVVVRKGDSRLGWSIETRGKEDSGSSTRHQRPSELHETKTTKKGAPLLHLLSTTTSSSIEMDDVEHSEEKGFAQGPTTECTNLVSLTKGERFRWLLSGRFITTLAAELKDEYVVRKRDNRSLGSRSCRDGPVVEFKDFARMILNADLPGTALLLRADIAALSSLTAATPNTFKRIDRSTRLSAWANPQQIHKCSSIEDGPRVEGTEFVSNSRNSARPDTFSETVLSQQFTSGSAPASSMASAPGCTTSCGAVTDDTRKRSLIRSQQYNIELGEHVVVPHSCTRSCVATREKMASSPAFALNSQSYGLVGLMGEDRLEDEGLVASRSRELNQSEGDTMRVKDDTDRTNTSKISHSPAVEEPTYLVEDAHGKRSTGAEQEKVPSMCEEATISGVSSGNKYVSATEERVRLQQTHIHVNLPGNGVTRKASGKPNNDGVARGNSVCVVTGTQNDESATDVLPLSRIDSLQPSSWAGPSNHTTSSVVSVPLKSTNDVGFPSNRNGEHSDDQIRAATSSSSSNRRDVRVPQLSLTVLKSAMGAIENFPGDSAIRGLIADTRKVAVENNMSDFATTPASPIRRALAQMKVPVSTPLSLADSSGHHNPSITTQVWSNHLPSASSRGCTVEYVLGSGGVQEPTGLPLADGCICDTFGEPPSNLPSNVSSSLDPRNETRGLAWPAWQVVNRSHLQASEPVGVTRSSWSLATGVRSKLTSDFSEEFDSAQLLPKAKPNLPIVCDIPRSVALEVVETISNGFFNIQQRAMQFGSKRSLSPQIISELCSQAVQLLQAELVGVDLVGRTLVVSDISRISLRRGVKAFRSQYLQGRDSNLGQWTSPRMLTSWANIPELLGLVSTSENGLSPSTVVKNVLILGNFASAGERNNEDYPELLFYIMALKILFPLRLFLLRGSHEDFLVSALLGEEKQFTKQFGDDGAKIWRETFDVLEYLPLYARISRDSSHEKKKVLRYACIPGDAPTFSNGDAESILKFALKRNFKKNKPPITSFLNTDFALGDASPISSTVGSAKPATDDAKASSTAKYRQLRRCLFAISFGLDDSKLVQERLQSEATRWRRAHHTEAEMLVHRRRLIKCLSCSALIRPARDPASGNSSVEERGMVLMSAEDDFSVEGQNKFRDYAGHTGVVKRLEGMTILP